MHNRTTSLGDERSLPLLNTFAQGFPATLSRPARGLIAACCFQLLGCESATADAGDGADTDDDAIDNEDTSADDDDGRNSENTPVVGDDGAEGGSGSSDACDGKETCACYPDSTCNPGLECRSDRCVDPGDEGNTDAGLADLPAISPYPTCTETSDRSVDTEEAQLPGATQIHLTGDDSTTLCAAARAPDYQLCLYGTAAARAERYDYENWGANLTLQMALSDEDGLTTQPWDAAALGITGFGVTLASGTDFKRKVRVQLAMVNSDTQDFERNPFIPEGDPSADVDSPGELLFWFQEFELPEYASIKPKNHELDPSQLHSVQFLVANEPVDGGLYDVCITNFRWLDKDGETVLVTPLETGAD